MHWIGTKRMGVWPLPVLLSLAVFCPAGEAPDPGAAPAASADRAAAQSQAPSPPAAPGGALHPERIALISRLLRYVPDDTVFVLLIPDVDRLVTRAESFGRAIGVESFAQQAFGRLLQSALGNNSDAVRDDTPMIVAVSASFIEPLAIVALTRGGTWREAAQATPLKAGGTRYDLGGGQSFVAAEDEAALFGRDDIDLEAALASSGRVGRSVEAACAAWLGDCELLLHFDVPAARNTVNLMFGLIEQTIRAGSLATKVDPEADFAVMQVILGQTRQLVEDARDYTAAVSLNGEELRWRDRLRLRADSTTAGSLRKLRRADSDMWRGLPDLPAAVWFACEWLTPAGERSTNELLVEAVMTAPAMREKLGAEQADQLLARSQRMHRKITGQNGLFAYDPQDGCMTLGVHLTDTPAELRREIAELAERYPDTLGMFGVGASARMTRRDDPHRGEKADMFSVEITSPDTQTREMLGLLYGRDCTLRLEEVPGGVSYALGDAARVQNLSSFRSAGAFGESAALRRLQSRLTPQPHVMLAFDLGVTLSLLLEILRTSGVPTHGVQPPIGPLPLAGFALYLEPEYVSSEALLPTAAVAEAIRIFSSITPAATTPPGE